MVAKTNLRIDGYGICPQFPVDETRTLRGLETVEARVVHGSRLGHRQPRAWTLTWDGAREGQVWVLRDAFEKAGLHGAMNFLPVDGGGIFEVIFIGELEIEQQSATSWKVTVTVEEVIR